MFDVEELVEIAVVFAGASDVGDLGNRALEPGLGADICVKVVDGHGSNSAW